MNNYTPVLDVWSLGCIFFEIIDQRVLFEGDCEQDQIIKILRYVQNPQNDRKIGKTPNLLNFQIPWF